MIDNYMKEYAERNSIGYRGQLRMCSGFLGTVDQFIIDNAIMNELRSQQRNLAVVFYDYQKVCDMVRQDWMTRVYLWMSVPKKVVNVIIKLMKGWKTRLDVTEDGKVLTSKMINIRIGFLEGDSYSLVGFCLTEEYFSILLKRLMDIQLNEEIKKE